MPLTNANLRSLLKENIHKDTGFSEPTDLDSFLTLGQERIVTDSPHTLGVKTDTITSVDGTQEYSLDSTFYQIVKMWDTTNGRRIYAWTHSEWATYVESLSSIPTGIPHHYSVIFFDEAQSTPIWRVRFFPTPGGAYTIKNFYHWMPAAISGSGTPSICRIGFSELLLSGATMIALERNDPRGAKAWQDRYDRRMVKYMSYNPQKPDETSQFHSQMGLHRGGSTLDLPDEFPAN